MWWNGTPEKKLSSSKEGREHCLFFQTEKLIYGHLAGWRLPDNKKPHHKILLITEVNGGDERLYVIGQTNNISRRMVVDTGANVSLIRKDLVQNTKHSIIWTPTCVFLQTVTDKPGATHVLYHEIDTGDKPPVVSRSYRYGRIKQSILDYHVEKMLKKG
ncbi:hypothetical protein TNCV_2051741 [Trichonephila clavipes]|nr:hypothetical protein TNCV_2051741 [Trichonephila clavipes]